MRVEYSMANDWLSSEIATPQNGPGFAVLGVRKKARLWTLLGVGLVYARVGCEKILLLRMTLLRQWRKWLLLWAVLHSAPSFQLRLPRS